VKKYRSGLIYLGLLIAGGTASAAVWIAATGTFRPAWWWIAIGSVLIGVASDSAEKAITRRLERPRRTRRRAHARTRTDTTRKAA
jgi:nicotinamide mononucleotide (NMN) deamidase PncC